MRNVMILSIIILFGGCDADTKCSCQTYEDGSQTCYCKDLKTVYEEFDGPDRIIYEESDNVVFVDTIDGSYGARIYYGKTEGGN